MKLLKKVFLWIVVPVAVLFSFDLAVTTFQGRVPQGVQDLRVYVQFAVAAGIAALFVEQILLAVVREEVIPKAVRALRDIVLPAVSNQVGNFTKAVQGSIEKKDFVFAPRVPDAQIEEMIAKKVTEQLERESQENPELQEIETLISSGKVDEAVLRLDGLVSEGQAQYKKHLLTALVLSEKRDDWKRAEELLSAVGEPSHFVRLSYAYWEAGDYPKAAELAESGLELAERLGLSTSTGLKNSLAYYYAELGERGKARVALDLVESELVVRRARDPKSTEFAAALDTLGYVQIRFGESRDAIDEGIANCTEARQLGSPDKLFFKHLRIAGGRLAAFGEDGPHKDA